MRERRLGQCWELGPWGTRCTKDYFHDYAHYDANDDSSFTTDWCDNYDDESLAEMDHVGAS